MNYIYTVVASFGRTLSLSVGMHVVFSMAGIFFLGLPTVIGVSVYALAISQRAGISPEAAFLVAALAALLISMFFAYLYVKVSNESFAVLGLASYFAFESLVLSWDSVTGGVLGISGLARPEIFSSLFRLMMGGLAAAVIALLVEAIFLKTWAGRASRAMKEAPLVVDSLGISTTRLSQALIVASGLCFGLGSLPLVWQIQFLDPKFGGLPFLIELLTIGIIALKPNLRHLVGGALFVIILPEILRFIDLPQTIFGHLRILIYSGLMIILIKSLGNKLNLNKRKI